MGRKGPETKPNPNNPLNPNDLLDDLIRKARGPQPTFDPAVIPDDWAEQPREAQGTSDGPFTSSHIEPPAPAVGVPRTQYPDFSYRGRGLSTLVDAIDRDHQRAYELKLAQLYAGHGQQPNAASVPSDFQLPPHPSSHPPRLPTVGTGISNEKKEHMSPGAKKWLGGFAAFVVGLGGISVGGEAYCRNASDGTSMTLCTGAQATKVFLGGIPGVKEVMGGVDTATGWILPKAEQPDTAKKPETATPGNANPTPDQQPSSPAQPEGTPVPEIAQALQERLFPGNRPLALGSVEVATTGGKATVAYGSKKAELPMSVKRVLNFMAYPMETKQVEQNGQKANTLAIANPFTAERLPDGTLKVTYDRSKVIPLISLGGEGSYAVTGNAKSGFKATRTSESNGTTTVSFLASSKRLKETDAASRNVNLFAVPNEKGDNNPEIIAKLMDLKELVRQGGAVAGDKCVNPATGQPLLITKTFTDKLDALVHAALQQQSNDAKAKILPVPTGEYDFKRILGLSTAYAQTLGASGDAKNVADMLNQAQSTSAAAIKTSGSLGCTQR